MFLDFLLHGLSLPAHEFLHGLLFVYGVQLHQLTPNSILYIVCFITLCESFLGVEPHWVLWKYLFRLRPSVSLSKNSELGGAVISVRAEAITSQVFKYKNSSCIHGILHSIVNYKVLNHFSSKNTVSFPHFTPSLETKGFSENIYLNSSICLWKLY
jgi:hypothetical protein